MLDSAEGGVQVRPRESNSQIKITRSVLQVSVFGAWGLGRIFVFEELHNILVTITPKTAYSCHSRNQETAWNIEYLAFRVANNGLVRVLPGSPLLSRD